VSAFLARPEQAKQRLLRDLQQSERYRDAVAEEPVWTNIKSIEVFDQMAQFICNRYPFNSTQRTYPSQSLSDTPVPVRPGVQDVTLRIEPRDETSAVVQPYPFDVDPLVVPYPARLVPNRAYASQDDFLRHYYTAERIVVTRSLRAA
jgi:hypothetical protein